MKLLWKGGKHPLYLNYIVKEIFSFLFLFLFLSLFKEKTLNWWNEGGVGGNRLCIMEGKLKNV
jgi:hypothetical protein